MILEKIKNRRIELGFTAGQLCAITGVNTGSYSEFERGKRNLLHPSVLAIFDALKLSYVSGDVFPTNLLEVEISTDPVDSDPYIVPMFEVDLKCLIWDSDIRLIVRRYVANSDIKIGVDYKCEENGSRYRLCSFDSINQVFHFDPIEGRLPRGLGTLTHEFDPLKQHGQHKLVQQMKAQENA